MVRWLAARVRAGEPTCLQAVFDVAQACLASGTGETRTLIVVGLFEDLQSNLLTGATSIGEGLGATLMPVIASLGGKRWPRFWQGDMERRPFSR